MGLILGLIWFKAVHATAQTKGLPWPKEIVFLRPLNVFGLDGRTALITPSISKPNVFVNLSWTVSSQVLLQAPNERHVVPGVCWLAERWVVCG